MFKGCLNALIWSKIDFKVGYKTNWSKTLYFNTLKKDIHIYEKLFIY